MADGTKGGGIEGGSVVVAEIPIDKVNPNELQNYAESVPGAEVITEEAEPGKPATVKLVRNFIRIPKS